MITNKPEVDKLNGKGSTMKDKPNSDGGPPCYGPGYGRPALPNTMKYKPLPPPTEPIRFGGPETDI